jgi:hypothetical protein
MAVKCGGLRRVCMKPKSTRVLLIILRNREQAHYMQSWQLQGAACSGMTRGLYRECIDGTPEVTFVIKMSPSDFCVNEVSISGVVADVSATPPCDATADPYVPVRPEMSTESPIVLNDDGVRTILDHSGDDVCASAASNTADPAYLPASDTGIDNLRSCFADLTEWSRAQAHLSSIASTFFSNSKPHDLFAPQLLLLSDAARNDKLLRKRAYNAVRAMFPFVSLTTPSPPG